MSADKKRIRQEFRDVVFKRDGNKCRCCFQDDTQLDAHHITDRNLMPNGGYVKENGISLCPKCHEKAEVFHSTGIALPGWSPDDLYAKISSTRVLAETASKKLK